MSEQTIIQSAQIVEDLELLIVIIQNNNSENDARKYKLIKMLEFVMTTIIK